MLASCSNAFASANKRLAAQIFGGAAIAVVNAVIGYRDSSRGLKTGRLLASTASNLGAIALVQGLDMQSRYAIALYCIPTLAGYAIASARGFRDLMFERSKKTTDDGLPTLVRSNILTTYTGVATAGIIAGTHFNIFEKIRIASSDQDLKNFFTDLLKALFKN